MLRVVRLAKPLAPLARRSAVRSFAVDQDIPTDSEQQYGRRKIELDAAAQGYAAFNRDPIVPDVEAGTLENPILVPSGESVRPVGYEDPITHQLSWFNLKKGKLHYVPDIGLYFKLHPVH